MKYSYERFRGRLRRLVTKSLYFCVGLMIGVLGGLYVAYVQIQHMTLTVVHASLPQRLIAWDSIANVSYKLKVAPVDQHGNRDGVPNDPNDLQPTLGVRLIQGNVGSRIVALNSYYTGPALQVR